MLIPQRTCIGCLKVKAKREMIRIVKSPDSKGILVDPQGKENGRGAYICPSMDCVNKALQPGILNKVFRISQNSNVSISPEIMDGLKREILVLIESHRSAIH